MKKLMAILFTAALAATAGPALADAGGTSETGNEVDCGDQGTGVANPDGSGDVARVIATEPGGTSGALVVCSDDDTPLDGRIVAQGDATTASGSACADGDAGNPEQSSGWACVRGSAAGGPEVVCGPDADDPATEEEETNSQTAAGQSAASLEECIPES